MLNGWTISQIACMSQNRVIGAHGTLPWHLPGDLKRFRSITMGHPIIMGRKTFGCLGRALPGRQNIVITRQRDYTAPEGVWVVPSVEAAFQRLGPGSPEGPESPESNEAFITGGGEIYELAMPVTDRIYLTIIEKEFSGDAWFPEIPMSQFRAISDEMNEDTESGLRYRYVLYERV